MPKEIKRPRTEEEVKSLMDYFLDNDDPNFTLPDLNEIVTELPDELKEAFFAYLDLINEHKNERKKEHFD